MNNPTEIDKENMFPSDEENIFQADDEYIVFREETDSQIENETSLQWKVLVVDDDESVHSITRIVLDDFLFHEKSIKLISAFSGEEAKTLLEQQPDIALILLDVVMENDTAGLTFVKYIRENLKNPFIRIILRTGQPGHAPEKKVMLDYDINDYKLKTDLSETKLYVSVLAALRAYKDLMELDLNRKSLEKIIQSSATLFQLQTFQDFTISILSQLIYILSWDESSSFASLSGLTATKINGKFVITAAIGDYSNYVSSNIEDILSPQTLKEIQSTVKSHFPVYTENRFVVFFGHQAGNENLMYLRSLKKINELDKNIINIFCTNVSTAFDNYYLNNEIETTQKEIIVTLGEIAEARSKETGNHVKRVSGYVGLLARKYGLPEWEVELLRIASALHDIGKLAIPDAILLKPDKLTPEEFEIIKTHSSIGYEMIKNSKRAILKAASIIALQHHEKVNGKGYPCGLSGDNIHIYGRIAAVADVFDALGSDRVYKKAWPLDKILQLFNEEKNQHFDSVLVDILLNNIDEFLEIHDTFPENIKQI